MFIPSVTDAPASIAFTYRQFFCHHSNLRAAATPWPVSRTHPPYALRQPPRCPVHHSGTAQARLRRTQRLEPAYFYRATQRSYGHTDQAS